MLTVWQVENPSRFFVLLRVGAALVAGALDDGSGASHASPGTAPTGIAGAPGQGVVAETVEDELSRGRWWGSARTAVAKIKEIVGYIVVELSSKEGSKRACQTTKKY